MGIAIRPLKISETVQTDFAVNIAPEEAARAYMMQKILFSDDLPVIYLNAVSPQ